MSRTLAAQPTTVHSVRDGQKFRADTTLKVVECSSCGITYAVPESLVRAALKWRGDRVDGCGWRICCPLGHQWWYVGENKEQRLRQQLDEERDRAARLAANLDQTEASRRAYKGQATRLKRRAAAGVCPCCNRSFKDLKRHMAGQHPDFVATAQTTT